MDWTEAHELPIFAPARPPYGANWVEQILGEVVAPLLDRFGDQVTWVWVTRYAGPYAESRPPMGHALPAEHRSDGQYRYVILRLDAPAGARAEVHSTALDLARAAGCHTPAEGWVAYDVVGDLGSDRFIREDATPSQRAERARLVAGFVDATVRLMVHSLSRETDGRWALEPNAVRAENPYGSFFESVRHLFFNATGVPTAILLGGDWRSLTLGTQWMHPVVVAGAEPLEFEFAVPIRY